MNWFLERIAVLDAPSLGLGLRDVDVLETTAARLGPGAEGLLLVPYMASAQTPYWDPAARGVLFGLAGHHGRQHIFRAIMEGIAFEQRLAFEGMEPQLDQPIELLLTTGGGSRSALWRQIVADVTGKTVVACREAETTSLGAGMQAAAVAGWYGAVREAAEAMSGVGAWHSPDPAAAARYDELFAVYREIYPRTCPAARGAPTRDRRLGRAHRPKAWCAVQTCGMAQCPALGYASARRPARDSSSPRRGRDSSPSGGMSRSPSAMWRTRPRSPSRRSTTTFRPRSSWPPTVTSRFRIVSAS